MVLDVMPLHHCDRKGVDVAQECMAQRDDVSLKCVFTHGVRAVPLPNVSDGFTQLTVILSVPMRLRWFR